MLALRLAAAGSIALSAVAGCGLFSRDPSSPAPKSAGREVMVEVESHNWNDVTVYLLAGGLPQRLGMVSALGNASFDFPSHRVNFSGGVRLRALPVAGRAFTSETILVQPGQAITWTLQSDLDASSFTVY